MGFLSGVLGGLAKGAMGAITGIPGALLGGAVDLASSFLGNELIGKPNADDAYAQSQAASAAAFERSYAAFKQRYQDTMSDMKAAGLNPILAAGSGGFNVSGVPQMSTAQSFMPSYPEISGSSAYQQITAAQKNVEEGRTELFKRNELEQRAKLELEQVRTERSKQNLMNEQERQLVSQIELNYANVGKIFHEVAKIGIEQEQIAALRDRLKQELEIMAKNYQMLEKESDWYKGAYGHFLGWLKATLGAFGLNLGAFGSMSKIIK